MVTMRTSKIKLLETKDEVVYSEIEQKKRNKAKARRRLLRELSN